MTQLKTSTDPFGAGLARLLKRELPQTPQLDEYHRLSGGASQETWAITATGTADPRRLILRRVPSHTTRRVSTAGMAAEAHVLRLAAKAGVAVPNVVYELGPEDEIGVGFITDHVDGETIARKILRDDRFAGVRPSLARKCGETLARIHSISAADCSQLRRCPPAQRFSDLKQQYRDHNLPRPVFELAFQWLRQRLPSKETPLCVVHGDFRNGNLIIDETGIAAVLDWEIVHLGDPIEDLAWLCVRSWRFGQMDNPAGGFGSIDELIAGYEAAGGDKVDRQWLRFWIVLGSLSWGLSCVEFALEFKRGDRTVERASIGRRTSETEIDLLALISSEEEL